MRGVKSMKKYNIGFIGSGKMAGAIIKGLLKNNFAEPSEILATQAELIGLEEKSKDLGVEILLDNKLLVQKSDVIVIATKPNQVVDVLKEISDFINPEKLVVSIAAGVAIAKLEENLPAQTKVVRVMPNTPAMINEGMSGICGGKSVSQEDLDYVLSLFSAIGKAIVVDEEAQMDIVTAISGSGPAFFYKVINDIALAGAKLGLDYEKSLVLSIQTAIGSAKMALNSNIGMENLINNVATKGGCTRVGVDVMEQLNTEKVFYDVIEKTAQKASELGK